MVQSQNRVANGQAMGRTKFFDGDILKARWSGCSFQPFVLGSGANEKKKGVKNAKKGLFVSSNATKRWFVGDDSDYYIWWIPEIGVPWSSSILINRIFHEINHAAIGVAAF